jgi:hypothetical protein
MGFSCRTFLIARDDTLWRLSSTKFDRMLRDPAGHCLPDFAGQRARMASVVVELVARNPVRVVRNTFSILTFDAEGRIDPSRFEKQQFALAESVFAPVFAVFADESNQTVVDATSRFIAQGGQWVPSRALARVIDQTALGHDSADTCERLLEGSSTASDSDHLIQSSRKPPLASDKIRGYPNGHIGRSSDEHMIVAGRSVISLKQAFEYPPESTVEWP